MLAMLAAYPAQADAARCGQTVTRDMTLTTSLVCIGEGLEIGANGVDINLNGETISGSGLGAAVKNPGYDNVTVKNGTLSGFDYGVDFASGTRQAVVDGVSFQGIQITSMRLRNTDVSTFSNNTVVQSFGGLEFAGGSTGNVISGNRMTATGSIGVRVNGSAGNAFNSNRITWSGDRAIQIQRSPRTSLTANTIANSSDASLAILGSGSTTLTRNRILNSNDAGILATGSPSLTMTGNVISGVQDSFHLDGSGSSKFIDNQISNTGDGGLIADSNDNLIEGNTLTNIGDAGFFLSNAHNNRLLDNTVEGASDAGITLQFSDRNTVSGNTVTYNESGVELNTSNGNVIEANDVTGAGASGISLEDSSGNQVLRNRANAAGGSGIFMSGEALELGEGIAPANVIDGNIANDNLGNGITVETPGTRVANNRTNRNHSWGIKAVVGVRNGGGNIATGNFEPLQCFNIRCLSP